MESKTQKDSLPDAIAAYWKAANTANVSGATHCFSPDGTVLDEGQTHRGHPAIHSWIENTTRQYQPVVEPMHWREQEGRHHVTARVTGNFPGSPAELDFLFVLRDNHIVHLEVT